MMLASQQVSSSTQGVCEGRKLPQRVLLFYASGLSSQNGDLILTEFGEDIECIQGGLKVSAVLGRNLINQGHEDYLYLIVEDVEHGLFLRSEEFYLTFYHPWSPHYHRSCYQSQMRCYL
jgi:hypothetical protein